MGWKPISLAVKMMENADEAVLSGNFSAAMENCYISDLGGLTRFPRLKTVVTLPNKEPVYLYPKSFRGDLHAVCAGHVYRANPDAATSEDLTAFVVQGGKRPTFAETTDELVIAAGGAVTSLKGETTTRLSATAPDTTHIGYIDGRLVAMELNSGRFVHSQVDDINGVWDPLDTFSAEGNPDNIVALLVSRFNELLLAGTDSTEQFDSAPDGSSPFFRRWVMDTGVNKDAAYTLTFADKRVWAVTNELEFAAFASQTGESQSEDIAQSLVNIDNWKESWARELIVNGQRFVILQAPFATNRYSTMGVTFLLDTRKKRWGALYAWDSERGVPQRWPGWSIARIGKRVFVGGVGVIYELGDDYDAGDIQRMLWRSAHIDRPGQLAFGVEEIVLRVKRGIGNSNASSPPRIGLRVNKNNKGFGRIVWKSLGLAGQNEQTVRFPKVGNCHTIQYEVIVTDNVQVEIASMAHRVTEYGR